MKTLYLPRDLKRDVERVAKQRGVSEAELIRESLRGTVADSEPPRPRFRLFRGDGKPFASRVDELLEETGFGEC